jgi:LuxR family maltose regulon positive regulatory protein
VARSELELKHPATVLTLHARAADWFRSHGHIDEAVEHLLAAGSIEDAARLVNASWLTYVDAGRDATVLGWLASIGPEAPSTSPAARVTAAWMSALVGSESALADHLEALADVRDGGPLPDGTRSVESAVALIKGSFAYDGPLEAMTAARRAVEIETNVQSPYHAIAHLALGHAAYLLGDLDQAIVALRTASSSGAAPAIVQVQSLSIQSLVEAERGDLVRSRESAELAMGLVDARGLRPSPLASLALTAFGRAQAAAGKIDDALVTMEVGLDIRRQSIAPGVWGPIHHLLATALVAALAGRFVMARELMSELAGRMSRFTGGMEAMHSRVAEVHLLLRDEAAAEMLDEPLTRRELDVLRLLQSDLNSHEIADELYLTFNTVKTHASAIYRKLGAHSRSEAVVIARRRSLI